MYIPDGVDAVGLCEREKESGCAVVFRETDEMSIVWCHWDEWSCRNKHRTESAVSHTSQSTEYMQQFICCSTLRFYYVNVKIHNTKSPKILALFVAWPQSVLAQL